ncbi:gustatory receptor for bitter taste 66a-like [Anopheles ziemanni]|uniref:gustatory receptor for bitter taste 66a-like n=1 Tax=Anopheles coustani TaxID=139045 RepID=UPI00265952A7|nr:gustatory receptor for bitter taste 66a-like [Anopheles coustani]XP_058174286.1 gustatory receptor for bitter taste 66a-like [Anopheles ziemanni]
MTTVLLVFLGIYTILRTVSLPELNLVRFQTYRTVNVYMVMVSAQVTNVVLLVLILGAHGYGEVIDQLDQTVNQLRCFEFNCSYWQKRKVSRHRLCCDASDSILRLNTLHNAITEIVQSVFKVLQILILLTNLNQFVVILSRLYFIFVPVIQQWQHGLQFERIFNSLVFVSFEIVQCYFLTLGSSVMAKQARKPGFVLNVYINAHLDVRTEQSMDIFELALLTTESKVQIAGMYTMDLLFLYSLATTATTYLLVLVQFQLNMP